MSTNLPVVLPTKTRQWATSAVVLGALVFLLGLQNVFGYHKSVTMFGPSKAMISVILAIVNEIVAALFVVAGAAVLKGRSWGREGLAYVSAGAIVMTLLGAIWSWITIHDPGFTAVFTRTPGAAALPPNFGSIIVLMSSITTILLSIIQIAYCVGLYRHMSAEPVEEASIGYAPAGPDSGPWSTPRGPQQ